MEQKWECNRNLDSFVIKIIPALPKTKFCNPHLAYRADWARQGASKVAIFGFLKKIAATKRDRRCSLGAMQVGHKHVSTVFK